MGLLFVLPVDESEVDRISSSEESITLKSYGLPLIFWGYLLASLAVIFCMFLAITDPLEKLYAGNDSINKALAIIVFLTLVLTPLGFISFFFYEKSLKKAKDNITITHKFFWIPVWKKNITLKSLESMEIKHYLDSPNMARIHGEKSMKAFENRGYFLLNAIDKSGRQIEIDRHSRKADLVKIKNLLSKY